MKILITGASGFIGPFLIKACLRNGNQVKCLAREDSNLASIKDCQVKFIYGDLGDKDSLIEAVKDVDIIYHLAAATGKVNKEIYEKSNFLGTKSLAEVCLAYNKNLKRFVYISSIAAVGPSENSRKINEDDLPKPISEYGKSKLKAENFILQLKDKLPFTIIRLPMVYGPGNKNIQKFVQLVKTGFWPSFLGRDNLTSFIYIDDLIQGLILLTQSPQAVNKVYFLTEERFYKFSEIGEIIADVLNKKLIIIKIPKNLLLFLVFLQEIFFKLIDKKPVILRSQIHRWADQNWICSSQKLKQELGFVASITLADGIKKLLNNNNRV